jgi:hypothetical protein
MSDRLNPGQTLQRGTDHDRLKSASGTYSLIMQEDGNLVLYKAGGHALWASNTAGTDSQRAVMQNDGNFVIYKVNDQAIWASNTAGKPGCFLIMQNDGNLVIYQPNAPVWATGTN